MGGFRVGEGCLLVPSKACDVIVEGLKSFGASVRKLETYASAERVRALFG